VGEVGGERESLLFSPLTNRMLQNPRFTERREHDAAGPIFRGEGSVVDTNDCAAGGCHEVSFQKIVTKATREEGGDPICIRRGRRNGADWQKCLCLVGGPRPFRKCY